MTSTNLTAVTALPKPPAALSIAALTCAITASVGARDVGPIEAAYPDWIARMRQSDEARKGITADTAAMHRDAFVVNQTA